MTGADVLGLAARAVHLAASILAVGAAASLLIAGRSDRPTARRWEARVSRLAVGAVVVALAAALVIVAHQTAMFEGRPAAAFEPEALGRALLQTRAGLVWLARGSLLLLLAAFLAARLDVSRRVDWTAARGQALLLAGAALALIAGASHAAAVEPSAATAIVWDVAHLLAAGVWVGGLVPLALLLHAAGRPEGADSRPHAVLATRRFSQWAMALVALLVISGFSNAEAQVGSVPALLGTPHGRLLLLKIAVFAAMLAVAALNRRLIPALSGEAAAVGRPAMRRLGAFVLGEAALAAGVLGIVALMSVTAPARHDVPVWPLSFRLTLDNLVAAPELRTQVLVGSQVAVLGAVGLLASLLLGRLRLAVAAGALVVLVAGAGITVPPLVTDAYPTTYVRPAVPYQAASVAEGAALFREHCAACHGPRGAGDGPAAAGLTPRPPDLRAHHAALHTAGDLYWWITHGLRQMPAFGDRLSEDERWHLVNLLRAQTAALRVRLLGPRVEPERPEIVAPDFGFAVGPAPHSLSEYRGRRAVLLVLYTLPASRARLAQLAERYDGLVRLGLEVIAVPRDADPDAVRRLGGPPAVLYPVVTDGAREIVAAYSLFDPVPHAEFLIDRQGYLRARWSTDGDTARDVDALIAELQVLNTEKVVTAPPAEHVH